LKPVPTTVIRHQKERLSKCSLAPLHGRPEMTFLRARPGFSFDATGFTLLHTDGELLSAADAGRPLLLLDSTWRWLPQLYACLHGEIVRRALPPDVRTAYPRSSKVFADPATGLASVEALYAARRLLGDDDVSLLAAYHWRERFLAHLGG
jgi:rRNA small subunit aminocarboxypropyltransferase